MDGGHECIVVIATEPDVAWMETSDVDLVLPSSIGVHPAG
jgi:hypothetical protein